MRYKLYVDRIFFLHFGMNCLLLLMTAGICRRSVAKRRLVAAALTGTLVFLVILLMPFGQLPGMLPLPGQGASGQESASGMRWVLTGKSLFLLAATGAVVRFCFGLRGYREMAEVFAVYLTSACMLGGALAVGNSIQRGSLWQMLLCAGVTAAAALMLIGSWRRRGKNPFWKVTLLDSGKSLAVVALMDSGNSLRDPISGQPVCIAERAILEQLETFRRPESFRIIPYHSIGKRHGLLQAAVVEELYLQKEGQRLVLHSVLVAASDGALSSDGRCQMLLHPALLEEKKGENHDIESSNAGKDAV